MSSKSVFASAVLAFSLFVPSVSAGAAQAVTVDSGSLSNRNSEFVVQDQVQTIGALQQFEWVISNPDAFNMSKHPALGESFRVVENGGGEIVGVISQPAAIDANGVEISLSVTWGVNGVTAVIADDDVAYPVVAVLGVDDSSDSEIALTRAIARQSKVYPPWSYHYDPYADWGSLEKRFQHDYCSWSPDSVWVVTDTVDFRGPCAYHDQCYESFNHLPGYDRRKARNDNCQTPFKSRMRTNCYWDTRNSLAERGCYSIANRYYKTVRAANWTFKLGW